MVVKIYVNKQLDGYNFSILPSVRKSIVDMFPNSHPARNIFVAYESNSDFERLIGRLEDYIYPTLLGVDRDSLAQANIEIEFVNPMDNKTLRKILVSQTKELNER